MLLLIALADCSSRVVSHSLSTQPPSPTAIIVNSHVATPTETPGGASALPTESDAPAKETAEAEGASATSASPTALAIDRIDQLPATVNDLIDDAPAHVGMVIALPDGTTLYRHEADTQFESASLYKLAIMVEVYRQQRAGELTFADLVTLYPGFFFEDDSVYGYDSNVYDQVPVGTLLHDMITLSRNVAATALLNLVGTDNVNATAASLGLTHTKILWYPAATDGSLSAAPGYSLLSTRNGPSSSSSLPVPIVADAFNITTPADIALLFQELIRGTVVSQSASAEMLDLLAHQQINDRLPAGVPDGTRVAHKTGDLDNSVHDAGVIYAPRGPIVVVVMTDEVQDRDSVVQLIQNVAHLAYQIESP